MKIKTTTTQVYVRWSWSHVWKYLYILTCIETHIENIFKAKYYINQYCISPDQYVS